MNRFFELDLLTWRGALFFDMFRDDIRSFDDDLVFIRESLENFAFERNLFFTFNTKLILACDDADNVSCMYFHFFHR